MIALDWADPGDWAFWADNVSAAGDVPEEWAKWSVEAARSILKKLDANDEAVAAGARRAYEALAPHLATVSDADGQPAIEAMQAKLAETEWWRGEAELTAQERLHAIAHALGSSGSIAEKVQESLLEDTRRVFGASTIGATQRPGYPATAAQPRPAISDDLAIAGLGRLGQHLAGSAASSLFGQTTQLTRGENTEVELTTTQIALLGAMVAAGEPVDVLAIPTESIVALAVSGRAAADETLLRWLQLRPLASDAAAVFVELDPHGHRALAQGTSGWAAGLTRDERTDLVRRIIDNAASPGWLRAIAQNGVDDEALMDELMAAMQSASNAVQRDERVEHVVALAPTTYKGQRLVADLIIGLLSSGTKVDFNLALKATDALGTQHRSGERLRTAFKDAHGAHGYEVSSRYVESLARAGIRLPKNTFVETAWDAWRALFS